MKISMCFLVTTSILLGCFCFTQAQTVSKTSIADESLQPQTNAKFADVPIPEGFKLVPQKTYSFLSSNMRVGVLVYQGKSDPEKLVSFFKQQMPLYNWNLLNVIEYGNRLINFDRDLETCTINIESRGNANTVTISLGPKATPAKKTEKLIK